jgi:hypothetical protein
MLMFETGAGERRHPRGWRSEGEPPQSEAFILTFMRQFSFLDTNGEYLAMNGLVLEFEFEPRAEHPHARDNIVGTEAPAWIAEVEGSKAFAAAFEHLPFSFNLLQTDY